MRVVPFEPRIANRFSSLLPAAVQPLVVGVLYLPAVVHPNVRPYLPVTELVLCVTCVLLPAFPFSLCHYTRICTIWVISNITCRILLTLYISKTVCCGDDDTLDWLFVPFVLLLCVFVYLPGIMCCRRWFYQICCFCLIIYICNTLAAWFMASGIGHCGCGTLPLPQHYHLRTFLSPSPHPTNGCICLPLEHSQPVCCLFWFLLGLFRLRFSGRSSCVPVNRYICVLIGFACVADALPNLLDVLRFWRRRRSVLLLSSNALSVLLRYHLWCALTFNAHSGWFIFFSFGCWRSF